MRIYVFIEGFMRFEECLMFRNKWDNMSLKKYVCYKYGMGVIGGG